MSRSLLEPFYYSKNERKGMLLFLFIVLLLFIFQLVIPYIFNPYKDLLRQLENLPDAGLHSLNSDTTDRFDPITESLPAADKIIFFEKYDSTQEKDIPVKSSISLFDFDPNKISKDSMALLGVSNYASTNWNKFRLAGGIFYEAAQMSKIYGLDSSTYLRLLPHVKINAVKKKSRKSNKATSQFHQIFLNQTTPEELESLRGIGPVLSERIVKFRDALGGFYEIEQVKEVYGISDSLYLSLVSHFGIELVHQKINVNELTEEQLSKHPYIKWKQAKLILQYRNQHGPFQSLDQMYNIKAFDSSYVKKIIPYLKLQ